VARYQVTLAYDGTEFHGFQRQSHAAGAKVRTVQSVVEAALRRLGWQDASILGAGRTDAGVHALGQVIAFDLAWRHSLEDLQAALNANLSPDIAVREVRTARPDFHPRYDAIARRYRYRIYCQHVRDPLGDRYAWRAWPAISLPGLQASACQLLGTHDFSSFGTPPRAGGSTVRSVYVANWRMDGSELVFEIEANAFLYHMVRRLVFAQVAIEQGKLEADCLLRNLDSKPETMIQGLAPPQGLCLVEVIYPLDDEAGGKNGDDERG
jgi:tRNA pseudouridine38-40 synthase